MSEAVTKTSGNDEDPLVGLRQLLALNRLMAVMEQEQVSSNLTRSYHEAQQAGYFETMFLGTHAALYQDWKDQVGVHEPGSDNAAGAKTLSAAIKSTLCTPPKIRDHNPRLFNGKGHAAKHNPKTLARILATFYEQVHDEHMFDYGNALTLDVFMVRLFNIPAIKGAYPGGLNFNRLDQADAEALHNKDAKVEDLIEPFLHALDSRRDKRWALPKVKREYPDWPSSVIDVEDKINILTYKYKGRECLVTMNGGLIPYDDALKAQLAEDVNSHVNFLDFKRIPKDKIIGYLDEQNDIKLNDNERKKLRDIRDKEKIDGITIDERGVPLFCADLNIVTGLRKKNEDALALLIKNVTAGKFNTVDALTGNIELKEQLLQRADGDQKLRRTIEIAYDQLLATKERVEEVVKGKFNDPKNPVTPVPLTEEADGTIAFGASGVGKSTVKEGIRVRTKGKGGFVEASLDEARSHSNLFNVMVAAGHHSGDYLMIAPFGNKIRDAIVEHAIKGHYNVLVDGTGIDHYPRNSNLAKKLKNNIYTTHLSGVDAFLDVALQRVISRFKRENRALPWKVTLNKHMRAAMAFEDATQDPSLDKISLFANDVDSNPPSPYLVAESFILNDAEFAHMQQQQSSHQLVDYCKGLIHTDEGSVLKELSSEEPGKDIESLIHRNPGWKENNVAYLNYRLEDDKNRVLLIYNRERFQDLLDKGLMNSEAAGPEGLMHRTVELGGWVDEKDPEHWLVRTRRGREGNYDLSI